MIHLLLPLVALAGTEGMPSMPLAVPRRVYSVESPAKGEALERQSGFGDRAPEIDMKNLMMVGGSGMEGMEMGAAKAAPAPAPDAHGLRFELTPGALHVGENMIRVRVLGAGGKPRAGLAMRAEISMVSMDMGMSSPAVKELAEPGTYELRATFSMRGAWNVRVETPEGGRNFRVDVK